MYTSDSPLITSDALVAIFATLDMMVGETPPHVFSDARVIDAATALTVSLAQALAAGGSPQRVEAAT
jgi:hypothetical protein